MMTPTRIVRMIGIAGLVGWMGMVGWVAKTTQAQNGGQNPAAFATSRHDARRICPRRGRKRPRRGATTPRNPFRSHPLRELPQSLSRFRLPPSCGDLPIAANATVISGVRTRRHSSSHRRPAGTLQRRSRAIGAVVRGAEPEGSRGSSQSPDCRGPAASGPPGQAGIGHQEVAVSGERLEVFPGATGHLDRKRTRGRGRG